MSLAQKIENDFLAAYKSKDEIRVAVLRMLKAAIKNQQVELKRELVDAEVFDVVTRQAKQRKESIAQFEAAGRDDLASREARELDILHDYLPRQLSDSQLAHAIDAAIAEAGATGIRDMGKVMKLLMDSHKGSIDGQKASMLVKSRLSG